MKRSTERILTTHTGSLPRPDDLADMLFARESGDLVDRAALEMRVRSAVAEVVRKQAEVGVDVVNDGEMGKIGYSTYVKDRLSGFGDETTKRASLAAADMVEFPEFNQRAFMGRKAPPMKRPSCNGPIAYRDRNELERDLDNFKAALAGANAAEGFLSAASPGVIAQFLGNHLLPDARGLYRRARRCDEGRVRRHPSRRFPAAGRLPRPRDEPPHPVRRHQHGGVSQGRRTARRGAQPCAPRRSVRAHPPPSMLGQLRRAASPRHRARATSSTSCSRRARWRFRTRRPIRATSTSSRCFATSKLPAGKILIPGVIDSTTNFIEHPEVVAMRMRNLASVVGRENVIAGTDCGFATFAGFSRVVPSITWAKFRAMSDGAKLASRELWKSELSL